LFWNNFLDSASYNVVLMVWVFSSLRKLMRRRLSYTIISLLMTFVVSLGTSLAGSPLCSPSCPDCKVVSACCAEMDDNLVSGTRGAADHLPGPSGCSHDSICLDGLLPSYISAANGPFKYHSALVQSHQDSQVQPHFFYRATVPVLLEPPLEHFPSLFLLNCSFLI